MKNTIFLSSRSKIISSVAVALGLTLLSGQASAGEWMVGANLGGGRNPIVGEDGYAVLVPVVAYRGERFHANLGNPGLSFFNGSAHFGGLGYSLIKEENFNLDLVGRFRAMGIDPDDNDELEGLKKRKPGFDAGIDVSWGSEFGELNGQLLADISGRSKGQELVVSYAYPVQFGGWTLRPELGVSWQSSDLADYYFGVDADESNSQREAYEGKSTVTPFLGIQAEYELTKHTNLIGGVGMGRLGDGISDSPIVEERNVAGGFIGAVYHF
ncbi:MAG: MipA/OmpV family protein [Candidatus Thiodiazotropha sp. DIVDIV]